MTATTVAPSTHASIMRPYYGRPGQGQVEPTSGYHLDQFDAHHFLVMEDGRGNPYYTDLWSAASPKPTDAYNVLVLTGGRQQYYRSQRSSRNRNPWWSRLANGQRDAYVVWGRRSGDRFEVFNPNGSRRTSNGRGVVYSRWPIFDDQGRPDGYRWQVARIEFGLRDHKPRPNTLMLKVGHAMGFIGADENPQQHRLSTHNLDEDWQLLQREAKRGFEQYCSDQADQATLAWHEWFQSQRAMTRADEARPYGTRFSETCRNRGWLAALDSVQEAWQLAIVLAEYRYLFPQVAPDCTLSDNPEQDLLEARGEIRFIRDPGYSGTTGDEEGRLLAAYLEFRPDRAEQFKHWMNDYVALLSNLRNYTGD